MQRTFFGLIVLFSLNAEAEKEKSPCLNTFKLSKQSSKKSDKQNPQELTHDKLLQRSDVLSLESPGYLYSSNLSFIKDTLEDMNEYYDAIIGGSNKDLHKYNELYDAIDPLLQQLHLSPKIGRYLVKRIISKERSEDKHYYFYRKIRKFLNRSSSPDVIEKRILLAYEKDSLKIPSTKIPIDVLITKVPVSALNRTGQALWASKHEDAEFFLKRVHEYQIPEASYFYSLALVEDYMYNNRNIDQVIQELEVAERTLLASVISITNNLSIAKHSERMAYYQDKLPKMYILLLYTYNEAKLKYEVKLKNLMLSDSKNEPKTLEEISETKARINVFASYIIESFLLYFATGKYSHLDESVFGAKYGITLQGFSDFSSKEGLISVKNLEKLELADD